MVCSYRAGFDNPHGSYLFRLASCSQLVQILPVEGKQSRQHIPGSRRSRVRYAPPRLVVETPLAMFRIPDNGRAPAEVRHRCQNVESCYSEILDQGSEGSTAHVPMGGGSLAEVVLVVLIFSLMYYLVYQNIFDRVFLLIHQLLDLLLLTTKNLFVTFFPLN